MERTIGLLGGGQLGQMLCEAANPLGIKIVILDAEKSPAKQVNAKNDHIDGSFIDAEKIRELARQVDILTVEIEHVDTVVLEEIAERGVEILGADGKKTVKKVEVQPSWRTIRTIQDKFLQKDHLAENGVRTAISKAVQSTEEDLQAFGREMGYPFMLKARKDAYDGRGNYPVKSASDIKDALMALKGRGLYAEKWANFKMELAVMVVKTEDGTSTNGTATVAYPAVETIHEDSICKLVYAPARGVSQRIQREAQELAKKAVGSLWGKGVFGVELFLMEDGELIVNEIAPRPHNSGHYTIEACPTFSQYKSQLLSILGLMPSFPDSRIPAMFPATIMLNILGGASKPAHNEIMKHAIGIPRAALHMYGKESKPARKIGHITIVADSMAQGESLVQPLLSMTDAMRAERKGLPTPKPSTAISSKPSASRQPLVAVTMGSDSDLPVLKPGLALLTTLDIPFFVTITSAHRTPMKMHEFASTAASKGFKVIIAAAGGAAHLPGMIASATPLPVVGVPVKGSTLDGMDSLLSIVQMPRGVPVSCVAINNSINAALTAARILGTSDPVIQERLVKYAKDMEHEVIGKAERLEKVGFTEY
ncbi:Phosphoribosylaminoimidazole carboxylase [Mollisia scopiformis]|uniref:Phosphoribosylaminoimidazole carboxylase n=1 Tax=Mollisia scopiformis TaxID=149040 RepID=A0A194XEU6_MOLSC|nr:Phosphoribosylaminoimidazole carboxylase [Mollisia scopiformis]KUJ18671.1 Phosphoribosylaminoimidazole carboxylase [Mollisia scopiformis]